MIKLLPKVPGTVFWQGAGGQGIDPAGRVARPAAGSCSCGQKHLHAETGDGMGAEGWSDKG